MSQISCHSEKMPPLQGVLLMLLTVALLGFVHGTVVLNTIVVDSRYHPNTVRMSCVSDTDESVLSFHRRVNNITRVVVPASREMTLEITPEIEGEYYCMVNGEISNEVTLVGEFNKSTVNIYIAIHICVCVWSKVCTYTDSYLFSFFLFLFSTTNLL